MKRILALAVLLLAALPAAAKDSLGIFSGWGAFRDGSPKRCYAIAEPEETRGSDQRRPFVSIGFWPAKSATGQIHVRLSRDRSSKSRVTMSIGGRSYRLAADTANGWSQGPSMDRAIITAIRNSKSLSVESVGRDGRAIVDVYSLKGAATAIDAAAVGCKN